MKLSLHQLQILPSGLLEPSCHRPGALSWCPAPRVIHPASGLECQLDTSNLYMHISRAILPSQLQTLISTRPSGTYAWTDISQASPPQPAQRLLLRLPFKVKGPTIPQVPRVITAPSNPSANPTSSRIQPLPATPTATPWHLSHRPVLPGLPKHHPEFLFSLGSLSSEQPLNHHIPWFPSHSEIHPNSSPQPIKPYETWPLTQTTSPSLSTPAPCTLHRV